MKMNEINMISIDKLDNIKCLKYITDADQIKAVLPTKSLRSGIVSAWLMRSLTISIFPA